MEYFEKLKKVIDTVDNKKITKLIEKISTSKTIFVIGNGGSASTASHMVCDLIKYHKIYSLADNVAVITALANDYDYEYIFSKQLKKLGQLNDLLIVITASGNSPNILQVVETAKRMNIETFGLLGFNGGEVKDMLDNYLLVKSNHYGLVEDIHLSIVHIITDWFKSA